MFKQSLPSGFHAKISSPVKTMKLLKRTGIRGGVKEAIYDLEALFARFLVIGQQRNIQLLSVFEYELSPVPPSLVDEFGYLRKGDKSVLVKRLGSESESMPKPNVLLVDANQLLYHIVWPTSGTVADIAESCKARLTSGDKYQGSTIFVIFDQYAGLSAKDHERQRRAGEGAAEYQLTLTSRLPTRDAIMKNTANKRQLNQLLCRFNLGHNINMVGRENCLVHHDEADITIVSYMLKFAEKGVTILILSNDTDVFVLLVYWCWKAKVEAHVLMERWDRSVLDINNTVIALGVKCKGLLGTHALSGCHTVSFPCGKDATESDLMETGQTFFLSLYSEKKSSTLNEARYNIYRKRKKTPTLKSLPPTDINLNLHVRRAHLQMLLWKAADKCDPPDATRDITNFGWQIEGGLQVMPCISKEPVAPPKLLDVISCSCQSSKACSRESCSCKSASLSCTEYCVCEAGDDCCNSLTRKELENIHVEDEDEEGEEEFERIEDDELLDFI